MIEKFSAHVPAIDDDGPLGLAHAEIRAKTHSSRRISPVCHVDPCRTRFTKDVKGVAEYAMIATPLNKYSRRSMNALLVRRVCSGRQYGNRNHRVRKFVQCALVWDN